MAGISNTQRTIAYLKDQGLICGICERWIMNPKLPGGGIRKDLFGFIDIIVISKSDGIIGIQSCGSSYSEHLKKICIEKAEEASAWLEAGGKIQLIGWRKVKKIRGGTQMIWSPRIIEITEETISKINEVTSDANSVESD